MKNSEAKAVLESMRGSEGSGINFVFTPKELHCSSPWVSYASLHNHATLDGDTFTADELEAIAAYMRDPKGVSLGTDDPKAAEVGSIQETEQ